MGDIFLGERFISAKSRVYQPGIEEVSDIVKKDYGCLEFKVRMPDKRSLVFGERTVS